MKQELLNRVNKLRAKMQDHSLDSYIITSDEDIWYFTNITYMQQERPFILILTLDKNPIFVVPKLEEKHVKKGILDVDIITYWEYPSPQGTEWQNVLNEIVPKLGRIGIENNVKTEVFLNIESQELTPSNLVAEQRKIKSDYEIDKIRLSSKITDRAMMEIFKSIYKGASVLEPFTLSKNIQTDLIKNKQFDPLTTTLLTVVWPAPGSAMPHSVPNLGDKLGKGPNVGMSYYRINGYAAECERTLFLEQPGKDDVELFHHMMEARKKALSVLKDGIRAADVDSEARDYLSKNGLLSNLLHRTGHGVGLGNHEAPFLAEGSDEILKEGMVVTIEPGIYIEGIGGYRHSDTILITRDGYELLTKAPLDLEDVTIKSSNFAAKIKGSFIRKMLKIN
ncbi:M24 family metallopeptidase [Virgibacillus doumboii]|uniref:M24 family metallopeptidase n=1 Tax=Virgibacillus doumboii TaxID=2697503 RepID=UPI0019672985|nr:Xaa-Pro peptidase family protein [Virgibacillus doumboii]